LLEQAASFVISDSYLMLLKRVWLQQLLSKPFLNLLHCGLFYHQINYILLRDNRLGTEVCVLRDQERIAQLLKPRLRETSFKTCLETKSRDTTTAITVIIQKR